LIPPRSFGQHVNEHLRESYRGKTFVLRGFPAGDLLRYNSSGAPENVAAGDWTANGFVRVNDIHLSDDRLIIEAQRMAVGCTMWCGLSPLERPKKDNKGKEAVTVEINANPGMHNPSPEQIDALVSKIVLTVQDRIADLVPDYWKPCVHDGLTRKGKNCVFSDEILAVPGVAWSEKKANETAAAATPVLGSKAFHMGPGITPPRTVSSPEPEFSAEARAAKYRGTVVIGVTVSPEGTPTNIHIIAPLGLGLDAKAVQAVQGWKFTPAMKDGNPVPFEIAVEVDFHLY
jgi:TonB family protein